ncbi:MAG: PQQ-binding-like beta-propeller repeat protein [Candidatus Nealsonbacteria bacterium]|nr:PQQ-binding-like beta-propeller repeat protein [Candidatus Nealsonbacteria bacterium]
MSYWKTTVLVSVAMFLAVAGSALGEPAASDLLRESGVSGGVAVHVGCGDGRLTAALHADDRLLVHGLDTDAADVAKAKAHIDSLGLYGKVSAERYDGKNLPHGDNIVNLIVIDRAADLAAKEVARVLVPHGVALVKSDALKLASAGLEKTGGTASPAAGGNGWVKYTKPWPEEIDEWTHYLYDASGNAVSKDKKVGHPRHLQWYAGPKHTRHHDALASFSAMTSSDGRVFYIQDEGEISVAHRPPDWKLVARDAFNGKLLWKRDTRTWMTHLYNFRAGPKQLPRRLVSIGSDVYVTLGFTAPVMKLDGRTGKTLLIYEGSEKTEEIIHHNGMLLVVVGDPDLMIARSDDCHGYWELAEYEEPTSVKSIIAYDATTGKKLWTATGENLKHITPLSLSAKGDNVFYLDNNDLRCLDAKTGKPRWKAAFETEGMFIRSYAPTVVIGEDVVTCLKWDRLCGYSIADGSKLWENKGAIGFGSPGDLFLIGGTIWTEPLSKSIWRESKTDPDGIVTTGISIPKTDFLNDAKTCVGLDIKTGQITDRLPFAHNQHHHRCYRDKATERYLLIGYSGIQLVDLETQQSTTNQWVRGICQYGIMPANGCIYVPPDPCQCYSSVRVNGFFALLERNSMDDVEIAPVVEKGPAFGKNPKSAIGSPQPAIGNPQSNDWPTYRGNIARSGAATSQVADKLTIRWEAAIGQGITAPVVAGDKVYVAQKDAYTVHCLDRTNGKPVWKFLANGPIDSPPTIHPWGLCLVGCGDGSVYCLDADSGELAWRFKVSAIERRIGSENRLESPLSISGSVLVLDNVVYFAAGRSTNLDGGIRVYGLDVRTGQPLHSRVLASGYWAQRDDSTLAPPPTTRKRVSPTGALVDVLVSNGETIAMRQVRMDKTLTKGGGGQTLNSSKGLLDDTWFHRQSWNVQGTTGQLVVFDDNASYSVANPYSKLKHQRKAEYKKYKQDGHLHQKFTRYEESFFPIGSTISAKSSNARRESAGSSWSITEPFQPRAMVLAGDNLFLAGWLDALAIQLKTGRALSEDNPDPHESVLRVYAAKTGKRLAEYELESDPVFDGAAAASSHLFISLKNGKLICLGE